MRCAIDGHRNFQERPGPIVLPFANNGSPQLLGSADPAFHLAVDLVAVWSRHTNLDAEGLHFMSEEARS